MIMHYHMAYISFAIDILLVIVVFLECFQRNIKTLCRIVNLLICFNVFLVLLINVIDFGLFFSQDKSFVGVDPYDLNTAPDKTFYRKCYTRPIHCSDDHLKDLEEFPKCQYHDWTLGSILTDLYSKDELEFKCHEAYENKCFCIYGRFWYATVWSLVWDIGTSYFLLGTLESLAKIDEQKH